LGFLQYVLPTSYPWTLYRTPFRFEALIPHIKNTDNAQLIALHFYNRRLLKIAEAF
jgi:hypothetical protein